MLSLPEPCGVDGSRRAADGDDPFEADALARRLDPLLHRTVIWSWLCGTGAGCLSDLLARSGTAAAYVRYACELPMAFTQAIQCELPEPAMALLGLLSSLAGIAQSLDKARRTPALST